MTGGEGPRVARSEIRVGGVTFSNRAPIVLIGGMNVLEDSDTVFGVADTLREVTARLGMPFVFKASFDKANRSSHRSYRGPGLDEGLKVLDGVKRRFGVPILTDVHERDQPDAVAAVADILQIPAFLSRQADLIEAACRTGLPMHVKKMQMMSPLDVANIVERCCSLGNPRVILCERGTSFGYGTLVVDPLSFPQMKELGCPVSFDLTHALQLPGTLGRRTGGRRRFAQSLALAGASQAIAAIFVEFHPEPDEALCDGPCAVDLSSAETLLRQVQAIDVLVKSFDPSGGLCLDAGVGSQDPLGRSAEDED